MLIHPSITATRLQHMLCDVCYITYPTDYVHPSLRRAEAKRAKYRARVEKRLAARKP